MSWSFLPSVNAALNALSALALLCGFVFIRCRNVAAHRACMLCALTTSAFFLVSYVVYHTHAGVLHYGGKGWIRKIYFTILVSHTLLAIVIVPLVLRTAYLALTRRFDRHRRWARWTLPLWFYVSVTGVVIYEMLY